MSESGGTSLGQSCGPQGVALLLAVSLSGNQL